MSIIHLQPIQKLNDINDYIELIPIVYRRKLANIEAFSNPLASDYFFFIIFSGFLPVGFIGNRILENADGFTIDIQQLNLLDNQKSAHMLNEIERQLKLINCFYPRIKINLISFNIYESNKLWPELNDILILNGWETVSQSVYASFDPFQSIATFHSHMSRLEDVYLRLTSRPSLSFVTFNKLEEKQINALQTVSAPSWAKPFHPALLATKYSKYSFALFHHDEPLAWLIADSHISNSLTIETIWLTPHRCSSAVVHAMFYLSLSNIFPFRADPNIYEFRFGYLVPNSSMERLHYWLMPLSITQSAYHHLRISVIS